ncbi:15308d40-3f27-4e98-a3a1-983fa51c459e [Thermothielavioides terrestris]|uniref:NDT80 domain-containing protein n=2 Tax=Thermothielavioides terrestris TaxID=2587410 RepID=G2QRT4_THETT|nr:uncharacterized protein THITE_164384 [Thermothielavioides terrestris NRRL 8126]AEO64228.1 hypothetical protein THITE_164384 [Thermothielavioides terrestris NRRL 8126]SPQ26921.1 15308d40-3f27-4e98-a3a1-983fa51c459e [Thermothielavioides terrestris]
MAGFNSIPAMTAAAPPAPDGMAMAASDMEAFNASMAFDESLFDTVHGMPNIPFTPAAYDFETFSTTFEDPFSYPARPFEGAAGALDVEGYNIDGSSPQELDNKLLGFGAPIPGKATLLTETGQFVEPAITGELYGMFFVAEDVFGADSNTSGRPLELTCYRRNLWQISGQITLPRHVAQYVDEQGRRAPVVELAASITAVESIEGRTAEMITIPWRGTNAPMGAEETKAVSPPPVLPIDLASGQEVDGGSRVSVPVAWKRLQFKHATANNGRRKGLQQHYVVQINLLVKGKGGDYIKVAEVQSGPVIVRGRSPRNFDNRKEVPLGDKRPLERRNTEGSSTGSGGPKQQHKQEEGDQTLTPKIPRYNANVQQSPSDWATPYPASTPGAQHASKKLAISSPSLNRPPVPAWGSLDSASGNNNNNNSSSNKPPASAKTPHPTPTKTQRSGSITAPQPLPINLSLSEDERSPPNRAGSNDSSLSPRLAKSSALLSAHGAGLGGDGQGGVAALNPLASPLETEDMLYEYFPLSLDDWMPPVDAIYRPHVVHHTIVPPEVKAQQLRSKAKRYFAAE